MTSTKLNYTRSLADTLISRMHEPRRFIQAVIGPRQVGKTTLANQVAEKTRIPHHYATADVPSLRNLTWIAQQWDVARTLANSSAESISILILDEIQKVPEWSEMVKLLWDEDSLAGRQIQVIILGSTPLLIEKGLTESLAGRFETLRLSHWSFSEMHRVFNFSLDQYLFFGGYPGAAPLKDDIVRWMDYIYNSVVELTISRDVLLLTQINKPALLRQLFELGCVNSGQIVSYNKMLGQLQDAGNTTTLAQYIDLLSKTGMLTGLQKFASQAIRRRASSPKFQVFNTALMSVMTEKTIDEALSDRAYKGRLVESAIGAHLVNATSKKIKVYYWRENNREVDFVIETASSLTAIEVKSGRTRDFLTGINAFSTAFKPTKILTVGDQGISVKEFLSYPVDHWLN